MTLNVAVLASGRGTNLQALLDAAASGELGPARIQVVISDNPSAGALDRARAAGVDTEVVPPTSDRAEHEALVQEHLEAADIDLVVLAGYMRILTPAFVGRWEGNLLNIHPSLLPAFPGTRAQEQAHDHAVRIAGCTVHFVNDEVDGGPIIAQAALAVDPAWDADRLAEGILDLEHDLLPRVVRWFAEGRIRLDGRTVTVKGATTPTTRLLTPGGIA